ncbi:MAG: restriction endonuclease [Blastocatellia bacterium]
MKPEAYEEIVADICRQFAADFCRLADPKEVVSVRQRNKFTGRSGQVHEIDVSVEFTMSGLTFITLIECKHWQRPVGIEEVMVLKQRLEDIGAQKGVLVSSRGFQKGAVVFAKSHGIALVLCSGRVDPGGATVARTSVVLPRLRSGGAGPHRRAAESDEAARLVYSELFPSDFTYDLIVSEVARSPFAFPVACIPLVKSLLAQSILGGKENEHDNAV